MAPAKKIFKNIALLVATAVFGVAAMETGVRFVQPQQLVRAYTTWDEDVGTLSRPSQNYHDLYGNDYWVRTNEAGFRQDDAVDMSPARKRVMVFGDSFAFGFGVNYEKSFFAIAKQRLEAEHPGLQLLNASIAGHSTGHVRKLMQRYLPRYDPAALIYFFNNNDIVDNAISDPDYRVSEYKFRPDGQVDIVDAKVYSPVKRFLLLYTPYGWLNAHSHAFVLGKDVFKRLVSYDSALKIRTVAPAGGSPLAGASVAVSQTPAYVVTEEQARAIAERIEQFVEISLAHMRLMMKAAAGRPLLVVWIPSAEEMEAPDRVDLPTLRLHASMRAALTRMAAETGAFGFVDTPRTIPKNPEWQRHAQTLRFVGDGHFNDAGNSWFAGHIDKNLSDFVARAVH